MQFSLCINCLKLWKFPNVFNIFIFHLAIRFKLKYFDFRLMVFTSIIQATRQGHCPWNVFLNFQNNKFPRDLFASHVTLMPLTSDISYFCSWCFSLNSTEHFCYNNWYSWHVTGISLEFPWLLPLQLQTGSILHNNK